jgi:tetratricopeptide (TPR) repeat protein
LTDTLVTRLASLRSIVVRPLSAVNRDAAGEQDPIEIGRKMQVDAVLVGTLQHAEDRFRINARLLRVEDGAVVWSGSFDESERDLFKLQDTLSVQVTESLISRLNAKEKELLTKRETENREAYHAYWLGRFFLEKRNLDRAVPEFQRAIKLDPDYAQAYSGLADAHITRANFTSGADKQLYEESRGLISRALELDSDLSAAHTSLAQLKYYYDWDWEGAERSFLRAIELDPNNVNAHQFYARLLATLGRYEEAIAEILRARDLDPRSADLAVPLFAILEKLGEYDQAMRVLQTSLEMDRESQIAHRAVGKIHLLKGEYSRVVELGNKRFPDPKQTDFAWASMLATAHHKLGDEARARAMRNHLKELAAKDPKSLYFLVMHYSELGLVDEAIAGLEQCLKQREERMIWSRDEPRFARIKGDARFRRIMEQELKIPN